MSMGFSKEHFGKAISVVIMILICHLYLHFLIQNLKFIQQEVKIIMFLYLHLEI